MAISLGVYPIFRHTHIFPLFFPLLIPIFSIWGLLFSTALGSGRPKSAGSGLWRVDGWRGGLSESHRRGGLQQGFGLRGRGLRGCGGRGRRWLRDGKRGMKRGAEPGAEWEDHGDMGRSDVTLWLQRGNFTVSSQTWWRMKMIKIYERCWFSSLQSVKLPEGTVPSWKRGYALSSWTKFPDSDRWWSFGRFWDS